LGNRDCPQVDVCEKSFENIEEKIKVANYRISDLEGKVDNLTTINITLAELKTISAQQLKGNEERDALLKQHSETLSQMNISLVHMNNKFEESDKNITGFKTELKQIRDDVRELSNDNKMKLSDIIKNAIMIALSMGFGVLVTSILK